MHRVSPMAIAIICFAVAPAFCGEEALNETEQQAKTVREPDVIFVPTPQDVVETMLDLAEVKKTDLIYDLGCGDGRIVVTAAKEYGCRAIGYDIDPERVEGSRENVRKNQVEELVKIEQQDIFKLDLSPANVITLYLLPELNDKLFPQLEKLKPGTRIVSHDFRIREVKPDKTVQLKSDDDGSKHKVFLWTTPLKKRWKWGEDFSRPAGVDKSSPSLNDTGVILRDFRPSNSAAVSLAVRPSRSSRPTTTFATLPVRLAVKLALAFVANGLIALAVIWAVLGRGRAALRTSLLGALVVVPSLVALPHEEWWLSWTFFAWHLAVMTASLGAFRWAGYRVLWLGKEHSDVAEA
jgi:SAM-dependent methyltransferase